MEQPKWDELVAEILQPIGDDLIADYSGIRWNDEPKRGWQSKLKQSYEIQRNIIRTKMLGSAFSQDSTEVDGGIRVDRHKIAAALTNGIMESLPLIAVSGQDCSEGARLANEQLAIEASISLLVSFGKADAEDAHNRSLDWIFSQDFRFPDSAKEEAYERHLVKALHHARITKKFDPFMYANIMFLLELHHIDHYSEREQAIAA